MDKIDKTMLMPGASASSFYAPYLDTVISGDVSEEFSLADYFPEVRRVISVTAKAIPEGKFLSSGTVDCDGIVSFIVTYLGEDQTVASAPFVIQYSQTADIPDPTGDGGELICSTVAENPTCRVTEPRKLSLKAHLRTRIFADEAMSGEEQCTDENGATVTGADAVTVERLCTDGVSARVICAAQSGTVSGTVRASNVSRAISADGVINIVDAHADENKVVIRGEAVVFVLCQGTDGIYFTAREKEPFETSIAMAGARIGDMARAHGRCASVTVNAGDGAMTFDVEYDLDAEIMRPETYSVCTDAYSTSFVSTVQMCEREIFVPIKCGVFHLTQTGEIKRRSEAAAGEYPVSVCASAQVDKAEFSGGKMILSGLILMQLGIAQNGDISPEEGKIPFSLTADVPDTDVQNPVWRADVQVIDATVRPDGDRIASSAELAISVCASDRRRVGCVDKVILDKSKPRTKSGGIRIYFPDEGESLWDIAKKYASCRRTLARINGWADGTEKVGASPVVIE